MTYATLAQYLNSQFSLAQNVDFCFRMLFAALCGAVIGAERSRRFKEAGVRTHIIVCVAAALMMIISKYSFADLTMPDGSSFPGVRGADSARIAAQVVSGISFLCAGVIFKQGNMVKGLTTAAGLWATAGIGLALGAGMYPLGIFATAVVLVIQIVMHRLPAHNDHYQNNQIEITVSDETDFRDALTRQLRDWNAQVTENSITRNGDGTTTYAMVLRMSSDVKQGDIYAFLAQNSSVTSFRQTTNT